VSAVHQHEDRQIAALLELGVPRRNILTDKQSGKDFERESYQKLLRKLRPGDCIFVKELDRFGRNYEEIIENWRIITKEIGADIVVLECALLDTRIKNDDLTGRLICDLLLTLLSYIAEMERRMNHQRQEEGIAIAKEKGVQFGRPIKEKPENFAEVIEHWLKGEISGRNAATQLDVAFATFKMWAGQLPMQSPAGYAFAAPSALPRA
jgi:DNA invertase Pin-like site-specific DNA recombinase